MCISSEDFSNLSFALSSSGLCYATTVIDSRDHLQVGDLEIEEGDKKGSTTEDLWSMSRELKYPHHEDVRLKLHDPEHETFPILFKHVNVMRQTQTSINNVSEHIINDIWTEAKGVNLSEEWTGDTRFQILRTRLPEGYKRVNGRHAKIPKTIRPDNKWLEAWTH